MNNTAQHENEILKNQLIEIVKHHKKVCNGENCNISLYLIMLIGERANLKFTDKEKEFFI